MKDTKVIKKSISFHIVLIYTDKCGQLHLWLDWHKHWSTNQSLMLTVLIVLLNRTE